MGNPLLVGGPGDQASWEPGPLGTGPSGDRTPWGPGPVSSHRPGPGYICSLTA